jgi:multidrug resistance efflux pump
MAMPGMPALELSDLTNLKISAEISEDNLRFIQEGKKVVINIPSQNINVIGTVSAIIPNSNPMTHSFKIKISFKNVYNTIYPGMYATVVIE